MNSWKLVRPGVRNGRNAPRPPRAPKDPTNIIAQTRIDLEMTQHQMAAYLGLSLRSYAAYERGERRPTRTLWLLCRYITRYGYMPDSD